MISKQYESGKLDKKFQFIYNLCDKTAPHTNEKITRSAALTTIALVKTSSLFGDKEKFIVNDDFFANENIIFFGALLLKLMRICRANQHCVSNKNCNSVSKFEINQVIFMCL